MKSVAKAKDAKRKQTNLESEIIIDNTAPLTQIVDDLFQRDSRYSKAYQLYHRLLAQRHFTTKSKYMYRKGYHYMLPGHPINAFTDDYDGTFYYNYFEEFPYRSLNPKYITKICNIGVPDPVTEQIKNKIEWRQNILSMRSVICANFGGLSKVEKLNDEVMHVPKYMVEMAEQLDSNPDPYFDDSYNWFYAGNGNLHTICVDWVDYLCHSEINCFYVSRFDYLNLNIDYNDSACYDCGDKILETDCSPDNIVALRTMYKVIILKIYLMDGNLQIEKLKTIDSELPYTSISFDKHHTNILYVTRLDCKLTIVNIDRMLGRSVVLKKKVDSLENNWNCVIGSTRATFRHIEKDAITTYDKRTNTTINEWKGIKDVADENDCNIISAATQSKDNHALYIATEHHLLLMDTRCSKKVDQTVVQRWTHGMQCVPTYISVHNTGNNRDLITLSSQWCEDMCIVTNYADRLTRSTDIPGVAIPYRPPSILNVLQEAHHKLLCCDLQNPVDARLTTSITGKLELQNDENIAILMQNSLGDITVHTLFPTYMETFMEDDGVEKLHEWSKGYVVDKKDIEISGIYDLKNIWKKLKKVPDNYEFINFEQINNAKDIPSKEQIYSAYINEEVMPELLDPWVGSHERAQVPTSETPNLNINISHSESE